MNRARHYFLFQFQQGDDVTLTTADGDLADELINNRGKGTGFTPWMETAHQGADKRFYVVPGDVLSRVNLAHVVLMAHTVGKDEA